MTQLVYVVTGTLSAAVFLPPAVVDLPYWIHPGGRHAATPQRRLGRLLRRAPHVLAVGIDVDPPTLGQLLPVALPLTPAEPDPAAAAEALAVAHSGLSGPYSDSALPPHRQPDPAGWAAWWPVGGRQKRPHVCDGTCLCFADSAHDCPVCNPIRDRVDKKIIDECTKVDN